MIDNSNAASTIGTLEFIDQITKFNTTKTICNYNNINENNKANFLKFNNMQELYENKNSGGMSKKYTIKHQVGKQKRNTKKRNI